LVSGFSRGSRRRTEKLLRMGRPPERICPSNEERKSFMDRNWSRRFRDIVRIEQEAFERYQQTRERVRESVRGRKTLPVELLRDSETALRAWEEMRLLRESFAVAWRRTVAAEENFQAPEKGGRPKVTNAA
jgi:hypothetical protein